MRWDNNLITRLGSGEWNGGAANWGRRRADAALCRWRWESPAPHRSSPPRTMTMTETTTETTTLLDRLLQRHVRQQHLSLVTSVLGASASWYGHALLAKILLDARAAVIHVSLLHDATFHADCARKWGIDLGLAARRGRYAFIDGLFSSAPAFSERANDIATRIRQCKKTMATGDASSLHLVVENPDVLLAVGGMSAVEVLNELLDWHEVCVFGLDKPGGGLYRGLKTARACVCVFQLVSSSTVMVNADSALVSRARTRLEKEESAFVVILAHQASTVTSLRMLDTGLASDVSGVLRVTTTSPTSSDSGSRSSSDGDCDGPDHWREKEVLYFVKDGSVEVFNRGQIRD